jgi:hypothetical protein
MVDIPAWLQGLSALGALAAVIWGGIEMRVAKAHKSVHTRLDNEVADIKDLINSESTERKRDVERIDGELVGIADLRSGLSRLEATVAGAFEKVTGASALIGAHVEALATRFADFKTASDKSSDEIKHAVRGLQSQVQDIAVQQATQDRRTNARE